MKISIITDEVSADFETAVELAKEWNLDAVEIRGVGESRYPLLPNYILNRIPELVEEANLKVSAISPGLFKIPFPVPPRSETRILRWEDAVMSERFRNAEELVRYHLEELLPDSIKGAKKVGAETIICFSFDRGHGVDPETEVPSGVIDVLKDAARTVEEAGLTLAVEVEHICWGDTGERTAKIVEKVGSRSFGVNWDPGNAYRSGEERPYPDGYKHIRDYLKHIHFKDAKTDPETGERGFVFDGVVDWKGQIAALLNDGYSGYISVETHVRPKLDMARRSIDRLRKLLEEA
jgi:sugar phosphate isomerase/epimerase